MAPLRHFHKPLHELVAAPRQTEAMPPRASRRSGCVHRRAELASRPGWHGDRRGAHRSRTRDDGRPGRGIPSPGGTRRPRRVPPTVRSPCSRWRGRGSESWTRLGWPKVESVTGEVDIVHATGLVRAAKVVFVDRARPRLPRPSLAVHRPRRTLDDRSPAPSNGAPTSSSARPCDSRTCVDAGPPPTGCATFRRGRHRRRHGGRRRTRPSALSPARGVHPLRRHVGAAEEPAAPLEAVERVGDLPLVVVGMNGWGDQPALDGPDTLLVGFVPDKDLAPLYAAARCSRTERAGGFGLPVLEAMAQGTPVVTSRARRPRRWPAAPRCSSIRSTSRASPRVSGRRPDRDRTWPTGAGTGPRLHLAIHGRRDARRLP